MRVPVWSRHVQRPDFWKSKIISFIPPDGLLTNLNEKIEAHKNRENHDHNNKNIFAQILFESFTSLHGVVFTSLTFFHKRGKRSCLKNLFLLQDKVLE